MLDSDFWRDLAEKFRALDPRQLLRASWRYVVKVGEEPPALAEWRFAGADKTSIQFEFESLARRGGPKVYPQMDSLTGWLEALRHYQLNAELEGSGLDAAPDGTIIGHRYHGSIVRICQASVDLCKLLEGLALETERMADLQERQKTDPKYWSPLLQQWEALKALKELTSGPHEEIPEAVVRSVLADQYGVKPEEVTLEQIRFEVAALLPHYGAIKLIPSDPSIAKVEQPQRPASAFSGEKEPTCAQIRKLRSEAHLSVEELAEAIEAEPRSVFRHLSGKALPQPKNLAAYQRFFSERLGRKVLISKVPGKCQ